MEMLLLAKFLKDVALVKMKNKLILTLATLLLSTSVLGFNFEISCPDEFSGNFECTLALNDERSIYGLSFTPYIVGGSLESIQLSDSFIDVSLDVGADFVYGFFSTKQIVGGSTIAILTISPNEGVAEIDVGLSGKRVLTIGNVIYADDLTISSENVISACSLEQERCNGLCVPVGECDLCEGVECLDGSMCQAGVCIDLLANMGNECELTSECTVDASLPIGCSTDGLCGGIATECTQSNQCAGDVCLRGVCGEAIDVLEFNLADLLAELEQSNVVIHEKVRIIAEVAAELVRYFAKLG
jgi:hypothetical protein